MRLSIYDMDKTITRRASWTAWLFYYARTQAPARLLLTPLMAAPLVGYAFGMVSRKGLKRVTQTLMMGRRVHRSKIEAAAAGFAEKFGADNELPGALKAIDADRAAGCEIMLATASCRYFVQALAKRWGIEHVVATENKWDGDYLTPEIRGENCYSMGKLRKIIAALEKRPAEVRFSSDHSSDLPVLMWADQPVATNPSTTLRQIALAKGWPIYDWKNEG